MLWIVVFSVLGVISIAGIILGQIFWATDWAEWVQLVSIITLVGVILIGGAFGVIRWAAAVEVMVYEETRQMVTQCIENGSDMENISITQTIIEQNRWLAEAKSSLKFYGKWSIYYGLGVEEMEYIGLGDS